MEILIVANKLFEQMSSCSPDDWDCGHYVEDPDTGECVVDLGDGCDCDSYMGG